MSDFREQSIFTRRSVRAYAQRPVEPEKIERVLRAAMQAPSALDGRPWEFFVYTDAASRTLISQMSPYAAMAAQAPVVIVLCADQQRIQESREEAWWVQDLSACTQNLLLQLVQEGLGGVWLGTYPREKRMDYLREALQLPGHLLPFAVVPLGYGLETNHYVDRYEPDRVHLK